MADPVVIEMANKLAEECLAVQTEVGDDRLFMKVGDVLGASSQTLEEAFLTAIRTRMANDAGPCISGPKAQSPSGGTSPPSDRRA